MALNAYDANISYAQENLNAALRNLSIKELTTAKHRCQQAIINIERALFSGPPTAISTREEALNPTGMGRIAAEALKEIGRAAAKAGGSIEDLKNLGKAFGPARKGSPAKKKAATKKAVVDAFKDIRTKKAREDFEGE